MEIHLSRVGSNQALSFPDRDIHRLVSATSSNPETVRTAQRRSNCHAVRLIDRSMMLVFVLVRIDCFDFPLSR